MELDVEFPEKLEFLFSPSRYKVLYGGRGSGKSWGVARALLVIGIQKPIRVLCARELQNSITDSVHALLADQIKSMKLEEFYEIQNTVIYGKNGTEFLFAGLKHNITKIKSFEGVDLCWVEEAQTLGYIDSYYP
jgi:phage terminase large subunit